MTKKLINFLKKVRQRYCDLPEKFSTATKKKKKKRANTVSLQPRPFSQLLAAHEAPRPNVMT